VDAACGQLVADRRVHLHRIRPQPPISITKAALIISIIKPSVASLSAHDHHGHHSVDDQQACNHQAQNQQRSGAYFHTYLCHQYHHHQYEHIIVIIGINTA
jgi:hypothetical protein